MEIFTPAIPKSSHHDVSVAERRIAAWDGIAQLFGFQSAAEAHEHDYSFAIDRKTLVVRCKLEDDDLPLWEWRRESQLRPIVFDDPGTMDDDVMHLHLEHRLVRRLLGRFTAQGFVHHDLSRACLAQSSDPIPRVILLGRLCLYGPEAARLHEELVAVTARWLDPADRKADLKPYARDAEGRTLDLLEDALLLKSGRPIPDAVLRRLQAAGPHDVEQLLPHLQQRGTVLADEVEAQFAQRGEKEAKAMRELLEDQKNRIRDTSDKFNQLELNLQFPQDEERRQVESNRRHWERRLAALDHEIATEPKRIRQLYDVKARRIEPVGLVYLWPVTG